MSGDCYGSSPSTTSRSPCSSSSYRACCNQPPAELVALVPHQGWYWLYAVNVFQAITYGEMSYFSTLHLWSLSLEEQFYIAWPFLVRLTTPTTLLRACGVMIVAALGIRLGIVASGLYMD